MQRVIERSNSSANPYADMPLPKLMASQQNIEAELDAIKRVADQIDAAIRERVADAVAEARAELDKPEGTVRAVVDGIEVVSNVPKRVEWDTKTLDKISGEIVALGYEPADWIDYKLAVSEKKYSSAPKALQSLLDSARTMRHGKESIKLTDPEMND